MTRCCFLIVMLAGLGSIAQAAGPQAQWAPNAQWAEPAGLPLCCDRCITYKHLRPRLEPCGPRTETVLYVKDCCECCLIRVPVCIPACCLSEPTVCRKGNHRRQVIEYTWSSGYQVRVIITPKGDVIVHYNA